MSFTIQGPLLLAGAGKMGGAILSGLLARGLDARSVIVQDPDPAKPVADLLADNGIDVLPFIDELTQPPGVILVAVKPQVMDEVMPGLAKLAGPQTLLVSIAAGRRMATFERYLPGACHRARHAQYARPLSAAASRPPSPTAMSPRCSVHWRTICCRRSARSYGSRTSR